MEKPVKTTLCIMMGKKLKQQMLGRCERREMNISEHISDLVRRDLEEEKKRKEP